ncbi:MAG TPA: hypothetical protein VHW65_10455 [Gemmatimonadales bacterium]|nr:hypothetical protein [Gemmatimonadales bacterium]
MRLALLIACAAAAAAVPVRANAQTTASVVRGSAIPSAGASPKAYDGYCPTVIEFIGHITVSIPGTKVDYQWERSNGSMGPVKHIQIGKPVPPDTSAHGARPAPITAEVQSDKWRVGLPDKDVTVWEKLYVLAPYDTPTPPVIVAVTCRSSSGQ